MTVFTAPSRSRMSYCDFLLLFCFTWPNLFCSRDPSACYSRRYNSQKRGQKKLKTLVEKSQNSATGRTGLLLAGRRQQTQPPLAVCRHLCRALSPAAGKGGGRGTCHGAMKRHRPCLPCRVCAMGGRRQQLERLWQHSQACPPSLLQGSSIPSTLQRSHSRSCWR